MTTIPHHDTSALIIGGTEGLGAAIAEHLIAGGCTRMVIAGRDTAKGEAAAAKLGATFMPVDLADTEAVVALVDAADAYLGGLNALAVAGATTERGSILNTTPESFDRVFTINTRSPYFALQRFAQNAVAAGRPGSVVNILTVSAYVGQSFLSPYAASKAALSNITRNAAQALRSDHIRVNGINCGWMDTPGEDRVQRAYHGAGDDWLALAEADQPMGTLVKPDSVARQASLMLSPVSGVMTGAIVDFDQHVIGALPE